MSKNAPPLACNNFNIYEPILTISGRQYLTILDIHCKYYWSISCCRKLQDSSGQIWPPESLKLNQLTTKLDAAACVQDTCLWYQWLETPYRYHTTTTVLWHFFRDHPGELVPEENFWTLWRKGRLTEADTDHPAGRHSIQTNKCPPPSSPHFSTGRMAFLPPNQQCQSTEGLAHSD